MNNTETEEIADVMNQIVPLGDQPTERELALGDAVAKLIAERNPPPSNDETTGGSP